MAVTLTSADSALKTYYLDAVAEQIKISNPFLAAIKQSSDDVWGKEVKKLAVYGVNGGIGAGTEEGALPASAGNNYTEMVTVLKNLYGTIEISDKAVRASAVSAGAFVNLLNAEMEGLIRAGSFNFSRMLFGDGSGKLATITDVTSGVITVDSVKNLETGMVIDVRTPVGVAVAAGTAKRVLGINRSAKTLSIEGITAETQGISKNMIITLQGSYNNEITGLKAIFDTTKDLYGLTRADNEWLNPYINSAVGALTEDAIQEAIDDIEERSGGTVNFILCSRDVRRILQKLLSAGKRFTDTAELAGGYKAITYNGIPVVADRFCPEGTMYLLNTDDFTLHQLCDWQWLTGDDGRVLKQVAGKPVYTATLVKYADLMCARPCGQGMLSGITGQEDADGTDGGETA